jgi:hypothetical protein
MAAACLYSHYYLPGTRDISVAAPQALIYMRHVCYHHARKLKFGLLHQHEPNLVRSVLSQLSP